MADNEKAIAVGVGAVGAAFAYSAIFNKKFLSVVQNVIRGNKVSDATTAATPLTPVSNTSGITPVTPIPGGGNNAQNQALGKKMAAAVGWTESNGQWACFNNIVERESGWDSNAANPTSDARGIGQKITGWSADYPQGNASLQIAWTIAYIESRYGNPCNGWAHEQGFGWY